MAATASRGKSPICSRVQLIPYCFSNRSISYTNALMPGVTFAVLWHRFLQNLIIKTDGDSVVRCILFYCQIVAPPTVRFQAKLIKVKLRFSLSKNYKAKKEHIYETVKHIHGRFPSSWYLTFGTEGIEFRINGKSTVSVWRQQIGFKASFKLADTTT